MSRLSSREIEAEDISDASNESDGGGRTDAALATGPRSITIRAMTYADEAMRPPAQSPEIPRLTTHTLGGYGTRMKHSSHKSQLERLRKIYGQVAGLTRMVEEERYCADILTQLRAVQAALRRVEQEVLQTHIAHCVTGAAESGNHRERDAKLGELFEILNRFSP